MQSVSIIQIWAIDKKTGSDLDSEINNELNKQIEDILTTG